MYGLSAIGEANGWSMAILGILIVFTGLVTLSIIISQLHKVLDLWENREWMNGSGDKKADQGASGKNPAVTALFCDHPYICPTDINGIIEIWEPLVHQLDSPFYLADLHELARKHNFPHPHLTINRLRYENILVPTDDCMFEWHTEANEEE